MQLISSFWIIFNRYQVSRTLFHLTNNLFECQNSKVRSTSSVIWQVKFVCDSSALFVSAVIECLPACHPFFLLYLVLSAFFSYHFLIYLPNWENLTVIDEPAPHNFSIETFFKLRWWHPPQSSFWEDEIWLYLTICSTHQLCPHLIW